MFTPYIKLCQKSLRALSAVLISQFIFPLLLHAEDYPILAEQSSSKTSVYVGEQTIYDFSLNTRTALFDFQPPELSLEHAWSETISVNQRSRKVINGEVWSSFSTRRAVHPLATGEFVFPALKFPVGVRVKSKRQTSLPFGFEDAFSDQIIEEFFAEYVRKEVTLEAAEVRIAVKPLPEKPKDFATQQPYIPVGATHITAQLSRPELTLGESTTIQVTLISTGNLNAIKEITLDLPAQIRSYAESARDEKSENNGALITRKMFRMSLVPRAAGVFTIPAITFGYFDPDRHSFEVARGQEFILTVHGNGLAEKTNPEIPVVIETPLAIATATHIPLPTPEIERRPFWSTLDDTISLESRIYLGAALSIISALITTLLIVRKRSTPLRDAQRLLATATSSDQISRHLRSILQKRFGISAHEYSYEEWVALIRAQPLSAELRFSLLSLMDSLENSRFSEKYGQTAVEESQKKETLRVVSAILGKR
jgi:hypothetical protein